MIVYKLNRDLTDVALYYWIGPGNGEPEEKNSFGIRDHLSGGRIVYPVDTEIYRQMIWPNLKKGDKKKIEQLTAIALDPPGYQTPGRTAWIPTIVIDIIQV